MSDQPVIALHLGVHKTATTYIQSRFYNSREILKENGISYIPLSELRNLVTAKINQDSFSSGNIFESIQPYLNCERLLISDENILGGTNQPKNNKIYSNTKERIKKLLDAFDGLEIEIFITLRSYVPYFISRYAESLRHFPFMDFKNYYRDVDFGSISWLEVIDALKEPGLKKITVTDFNELFYNEQAYLELLTGKKGLALESADDNPSIRRAKFSRQGYEVVKHYARHYAPGSTKKIMRIIDTTHQEVPVTPFMPFSTERQKKMDERFASELSILDTDHDGLITVTSFGKILP